jgi:hydrogenase maturation protein HypF
MASVSRDRWHPDDTMNAHPRPTQPINAVADHFGTRQRLGIRIRGAVQGVGFRPFVYRIAIELGLCGWVVNDSRGVVIDVDGSGEALARFLERIRIEQPPQSMIHELTADWLPAAGYEHFEIRQSQDEGSKTAVVLPDLATCPSCLAELLDPSDRRFRYPFTNCTRCGPRFSIVEALPYDRPNTTMRGFAMCPACRTEYADPSDRRFHAQPNACPVCGPRLALWQRRDDAVARDEALTRDSAGEWAEVAVGDEALCVAAAAIRAGRIVAVKGLGGFHVFVDAGDAEAIARLRKRKQRVEKPFALMVGDLDALHRICVCPPAADALLVSPQAPIVLLPRREQAAIGGDPVVADAVAPDNPTLGVMVPATPLHHLLMQEVGRPVVATSGNLSDEPICIDEHDATRRLGGIADAFLVHDRPIARHLDDSVVRIIAGEPRILRRSRGYAPLPVIVPFALPPVLAVGAHLKNAIALSIDRQVFVSQHIGDLETPEAIAAFERVIEDFLALYDVTPAAIAYDLHPDYRSSRWAQAALARYGEGPSAGPIGVPVQHHHAHLAACMAENHADGTVLGVIWDGTGYGGDGTIWGGEFLLGGPRDVRRVAHLRPFPLPGGDAAAREPRRVALALLREAYGDDPFDWEDIAPVAAFDPRERGLLLTMMRRGVNTPPTSSMGRLFDGVAALVGLHQRVNFEGQAAMALEFAVDPSVTDAYPMDIRPSALDAEIMAETHVIDWRPMLDAVIGDVRRGVGRGIIAARFHNALVEGLLTVAQIVGNARIALSGGCFQNRVLLERAARRLEDEGFDVLLHRQVPTNDGGISLGQVVVAAAHLALRED